MQEIGTRRTSTVDPPFSDRATTAVQGRDRAPSSLVRAARTSGSNVPRSVPEWVNRGC